MSNIKITNMISPIATKIAAYANELNNLPTYYSQKEVSRQEFALLLSGIATCRIAPGIPSHMGYDALYYCSSDEDKDLLKSHLNEVFGISDKNTLLDFCECTYSSHVQYQQFMTFWMNAPMFDVDELNSEARGSFDDCKSVSAEFFPILKEKGYYAWDISEKIGLYRKSVACGILSEEEFWELSNPLVALAQVFYHSYAEYAISCLCGSVYFMHTFDSNVEDFYNLNYDLVCNLFSDDGAWRRSKWYTPAQREWADVFNFNPGCIITKAALDSENIGYMYCEEPSTEYPDCGWRFFLGNESEEYMSNPDNAAICSINDICNIDPTIAAYFYADYGRRFVKTENGWEEEL